MGNGRIDFHGFKRLLLLLGRGLVLHGAHIVQPVGNFDKDDPDVLAHSQQHLAQIFHLLLCLGDVLHPRQLAYALHQIGNRGRKGLGHLLMGYGGVFNRVVQQSSCDGLRVQMQLLRHNLRHRQRVGNKGGAILPVLPPVGLLSKGKGPVNQVKICAGVIGPHRVFQPFVFFLYIHCPSPRFLCMARRRAAI